MATFRARINYIGLPFTIQRAKQFPQGFWIDEDLLLLNIACYTTAITYPDTLTIGFIQEYYATLSEPWYDFQRPHLEFLAQRVEDSIRLHANALRQTFLLSRVPLIVPRALHIHTTQRLANQDPN